MLFEINFSDDVHIMHVDKEQTVKHLKDLVQDTFYTRLNGKNFSLKTRVHNGSKLRPQTKLYHLPSAFRDLDMFMDDDTIVHRLHVEIEPMEHKKPFWKIF